jgi:hypothetical protein
VDIDGGIISAIPWTDPINFTTNPLGGYIEARTPANPAELNSRELRWLDEAMQPIGDWHTAITKPAGYDAEERIVVDRKGRALILQRAYPPSFGPPSDSSTWVFTARWMGPDGPLSDNFKPIPPEIIWNGKVGFAGWGTMIPLEGGGIAAYSRANPTSGLSASPSGWYAWYPSGEARSVEAPSWMQQYDGSLELLTGGKAYAATRRDPNTCGRSALIIALSGATCFTVQLAGSAICNSTDAVWPDGTLVVESSAANCERHWWPRLARLDK